MMSFQPNLQTDEAEKMATLGQSTDIETALTNDAKFLLVDLTLPGSEFLQISFPCSISCKLGFKLSLLFGELS
jgi:hypothetical protein